MEKPIEPMLNSLKYNIMSSEEQEAEERRLIEDCIKRMVEFFHLAGTGSICGNDILGYSIEMYHNTNDVLFHALGMADSKRDFVHRILGYDSMGGNFPAVHNIHDLYLVVTAMYNRCGMMGISGFAEKNTTEVTKDTKFSIIKVPSIITLNFNY